MCKEDLHNIVYTSGGKNTVAETKPEHKDSTYGIISRMAYLCGVPKRIFENENEPPRLEVYEMLQENSGARIIRNLCMLRTSLERNYSAITNAIRYSLNGIQSLPDLIPQDCLNELSAEGIEIVKANYMVNSYLIDINRLIADRINNCKDLFPIWLKWEYIRELFIMPNGLKEEGLRSAAREYYSHKSDYPYQVYMNWYAFGNGNIFYNDKKFVELLYQMNEDVFYDNSKLLDAKASTKAGFMDFLRESQHTVLIVDCENSDPFKLVAMLQSMSGDGLSQHISKIVLCDDEHTPEAWNIIEHYTDIPIEYLMVDRVTQRKSLVDVRLTAQVCRERFENSVDSFVLASSDSDYWGLISAIPEARYYVLLESKKCGQPIREALENGGYAYCFLDEFCSANDNAIKVDALHREVSGLLDEEICFNIRDLLDEAFTVTRADFSSAEKSQFYKRYIKDMRLVIDADGWVHAELSA